MTEIRPFQLLQTALSCFILALQKFKTNTSYHQWNHLQLRPFSLYSNIAFDALTLSESSQFSIKSQQLLSPPIHGASAPLIATYKHSGPVTSAPHRYTHTQPPPINTNTPQTCLFPPRHPDHHPSLFSPLCFSPPGQQPPKPALNYTLFFSNNQSWLSPLHRSGAGQNPAAASVQPPHQVISSLSLQPLLRLNTTLHLPTLRLILTSPQQLNQKHTHIYICTETYRYSSTQTHLITTNLNLHSPFSPTRLFLHHRRRSILQPSKTPNTTTIEFNRWVYTYNHTQPKSHLVISLSKSNRLTESQSPQTLAPLSPPLVLFCVYLYFLLSLFPNCSVMYYTSCTPDWCTCLFRFIIKTTTTPLILQKKII